jgi:hypothetical protein
LAERGEVTPIVGLVNRMSVVRRVGGVDLSGAMSGEKRSEGFIEQGGIVAVGAQSSGLLEE